MPTFAQALRRSLLEAPDQVALRLLYARQPERALTTRDLLRGATAYAQALHAAGVRPGEVVILILTHGEALVYSFFGAVLLGAVPSIMPFLTEKLLPDQYRASLRALFEITQPGAIVTYSDFAGEVRAAVENSPTGKESVRAVLNAEEIPEDVPDEKLLSLARGEAGGVFAGLDVDEDSIVLLQHSSGTTGLQKGVALSHRAVFSQLASYSRALHLNRQDVIVSWLPLYHDMGLIAGFLMPILERVPLVLLSPFDWVRAPYRLMQAVSSYRGTLTWLPNFAYNFCAQKIRARDLEGVDLSSWRAVTNCSEPMYWNSHELFARRFAPYGLRQEALATCYAMAENVFAVTQGGIDAPVTVDLVRRTSLQEEQVAEPATKDTPDEETVRMLSAGRPIDNTRVRVLNPAGEDLPERAIGEIALQSDCMLTGYYRRPDVTEKAFLDGWYMTGDLGYLTGGEVYITGRKKDLIIVGGKNIYPQDLERLAGGVSGVHPGRVVAFGVFNEESGTEEVVIVAESEAELSAEERERVALDVRRGVARGSDIIASDVLIVPRGWLYKTSSGKIARAANRERYLQVKAEQDSSE